MKRQLILGVVIALVSCTRPTAAQIIDVPFDGSPSAMVSQTIGLTDITVRYSRPRVIDGDQDKTGKIWGKEVAYGFNKIGFGYQQEIPWTAGRNHNTVISFEHDVRVDGHDLSAGTYGFYIAVYEDGAATLIFSSNHNSWESFWYHPDNDVLRIDTQMEEAPFTNSLTYSFGKIGETNCELALSWEKKRIPFKIDIDVHKIALDSFEEDLKGTVGFGSEGPAAAAEYLLEKGVYLDQALIYSQWALNNARTVRNMILRVSALLKTGEEEESTQLLGEIVQIATAWEMYFLTQELIIYEKQQLASDLLTTAMQRHEEQPIAHVSMGEVHKANGHFDKAMRSAETAYSLEPDPFVKGLVESFVEDLETKM